MTGLAFRSWRKPEPGATLDGWQSGHCAGCGRGGSLVLDHCHATGLTRGYLCQSCNLLEGQHNPRWRGWIAGDNAAALVGEFSVYVSTTGTTPLAPNSALNYYTLAERADWWRDTLADLAAGGAWPTEAPWSTAARDRRDYDWGLASNALTALLAEAGWEAA